MLNKKYDHKIVEKHHYSTWKNAGYFKSGDESKQPYTIMIPPPNVTGKLHLGHAWDNTLQDIIIRQKRMQGYDALYLPGMDHAGIATQAKIDAKLKAQGIDRLKLGREKFLKEAWKWKEEYAEHIYEQWAAFGLSLDYDQERFTLDDGLSETVRDVFIKLYEKGLIYRKERIINWDIEAKTALSNIEVEHFEIDGALYYFKYVIAGEEDYILVATTRPETMFGDTAVMIHPEDKKRAKFIGKKAFIPGTNVTIPIIADAYVDREFGTGAVKVTPAHDSNDFIVGERHNLSMPLCMEEDGTMNARAFQYEGMNRFACRKQLVKDLQARKLIEKIEPYTHSVGHSERTGVIVEPRLSMQWFINMEPLAKQALNASTATFIPARFEKTFRLWMENIQDWCISRQLWWGHRIPAYYKGNDLYVGTNPPEGYRQDEDVLDTWFSSALWPFSTLGWPEETSLYQRYYPTDTMVTGYDIIFFWVARMIFQGLEFTGKTPFKNVLIHGLIRDEQGRKMSKSLGNGIDPLDIKEAYGIDTLRYFLTTNSAPGQDLRYEQDKGESSWNYINKLWNIARFILMHIENIDAEALHIDYNDLTLTEKWILSRYEKARKEVDQNYERFEFGEVAKRLYSFTWDEFASWYIEIAKIDLQTHRKNTKAILATLLENVMKLLHPFMPFVTEEIYQKLPNKTCASIMISSWPTTIDALNDQAEEDFSIIQALIQKTRNIRTTYHVSPTKPIDIMIETDEDTQRLLAKERTLLKHFMRFGRLDIGNRYSINEEIITATIRKCTLKIPLGSLVDLKEELLKQRAELKRLKQEIARAEGMLNNENFVKKAPKAKVDNEQKKLREYQAQHQAVLKRIEELSKNV